MPSIELISHLAPKLKKKQELDPKKPFKIGTSDLCDLRIYGPGISAIHSKIEFQENGNAMLINISRTNPTLKNDKKFTGPQLLEDGDTFTIMDRVFLFHTDTLPSTPDVKLSKVPMSEKKLVNKTSKATTSNTSTEETKSTVPSTVSKSMLNKAFSKKTSAKLPSLKELVEEPSPVNTTTTTSTSTPIKETTTTSTTTTTTTTSTTTATDVVMEDTTTTTATSTTPSRLYPILEPMSISKSQISPHSDHDVSGTSDSDTDDSSFKSPISSESEEYRNVMSQFKLKSPVTTTTATSSTESTPGSKKLVFNATGDISYEHSREESETSSNDMSMSTSNFILNTSADFDESMNESYVSSSGSTGSSSGRSPMTPNTPGTPATPYSAYSSSSRSSFTPNPAAFLTPMSSAKPLRGILKTPKPSTAKKDLSNNDDDDQESFIPFAMETPFKAPYIPPTPMPERKIVSSTPFTNKKVQQQDEPVVPTITTAIKEQQQEEVEIIKEEQQQQIDIVEQEVADINQEQQQEEKEEGEITQEDEQQEVDKPIPITTPQKESFRQSPIMKLLSTPLNSVRNMFGSYSASNNNNNEIKPSTSPPLPEFNEQLDASNHLKTPSNTPIKGQKPQPYNHISTPFPVNMKKPNTKSPVIAMEGLSRVYFESISIPPSVVVAAPVSIPSPSIPSIVAPVVVSSQVPVSIPTPVSVPVPTPKAAEVQAPKEVIKIVIPKSMRRSRKQKRKSPVFTAVTSNSKAACHRLLISNRRSRVVLGYSQLLNHTDFRDTNPSFANTLDKLLKKRNSVSFSTKVNESIATTTTKKSIFDSSENPDFITFPDTPKKPDTSVDIDRFSPVSMDLVSSSSAGVQEDDQTITQESDVGQPQQEEHDDEVEEEEEEELEEQEEQEEEELEEQEEHDEQMDSQEDEIEQEDLVHDDVDEHEEEEQENDEAYEEEEENDDEDLSAFDINRDDIKAAIDRAFKSIEAQENADSEVTSADEGEQQEVVEDDVEEEEQEQEEDADNIDEQMAIDNYQQEDNLVNDAIDSTPEEEEEEQEEQEEEAEKDVSDGETVPVSDDEDNNILNISINSQKDQNDFETHQPEQEQQHEEGEDQLLDDASEQEEPIEYEEELAMETLSDREDNEIIKNSKILASPFVKSTATIHSPFKSSPSTTSTTTTTTTADSKKRKDTDHDQLEQEKVLKRLKKQTPKKQQIQDEEEEEEQSNSPIKIDFGKQQQQKLETPEKKSSKSKSKRSSKKECRSWWTRGTKRREKREI